MTRRDPSAKGASGMALSPYDRGVGTVALGLLLWILLGGAVLIAMSGSPGEWLSRRIPLVPPTWWTPVIVVLVTYIILPLIIPLMQRLSRCRACGKSTFITSEHLKEWDTHANPNQRAAGGRRFWPEAECSECHADLHAPNR
jgi:hypothetical protein